MLAPPLNLPTISEQDGWTDTVPMLLVELAIDRHEACPKRNLILESFDTLATILAATLEHELLAHVVIGCFNVDHV